MTIADALPLLAILSLAAVAFALARTISRRADADIERERVSTSILKKFSDTIAVKDLVSAQQQLSRMEREAVQEAASASKRPSRMLGGGGGLGGDADDDADVVVRNGIPGA